MLSPGENRMQSIVGTWKLLHATARDAAGAARPLPYGGKALGRLTLTGDGRMMSVVCDGRTELPAGVRREYSSYCGNYTYDGERLVTRVDAASDPSRIGSDQVRGVRFEGERMVLIPPPRLTGESENTGRSPGNASRRSRSDQEPEVRIHLSPGESHVRTRRSPTSYVNSPLPSASRR
jgi:hypothetical protein